MLLPDLRISPYVKSYVGSINKEAGEVLNKKISDYDIAKANDDMLAYQADLFRNSVAPFENDQSEAMRMFNHYLGRIDERVKVGDYENMIQDTTRDARKFAAESDPLMQNYKRYSDWRQSMDKELTAGNIGKDTYNATMNYIKTNYKGLDRANIPGTLFQGYNPGKDYDITEFVNKVGNDWESQKIGGMVQVGDMVFKKDTDTLPPEYLRKGLQHFVDSNREYQSYKRSRGEIGLGEKVQTDEMNALIGGIMKYSKANESLGFDAGYTNYLKGERERNQYLRDIGVISANATTNPAVTNEFSGLKFDDAIQDVSLDDKYAEKLQDGKYIKHYNAKTGELLTPKQASDLRLSRSQYSTKDPVETVELSSEDIAKHEGLAKQKLDELITNAVEYNKSLRFQDQKPEMWFHTPEGRKFVLNQYNEAIKESEVLKQNRKVVAPVEYKNRNNGIDRIVAENLEGRVLNILSSDKNEAGRAILDNEEGQDFAAFRKKWEADGWTIKETKGDGIYTVNTYGENPAVGVKVLLEKGTGADKKVKEVPMSAELRPDEFAFYKFKPLQDVMKLATSGRSGTIDVDDNIQLEVKSSVPLFQGDKNFKSTVTVTQKDDNGAIISSENVSIDSFPKYYTEMLRQSLEASGSDGKAALDRIFGSTKNTESK